MTKAFIFLLLFFYSCFAQIPAPPRHGAILLENAVIHSLAGPVVKNGQLLLENGKIVELGPAVEKTGADKRVDLQGQHIYPAMIECSTLMGLVEIGAVKAMRDYAEMGDLNPNVRAETAVNGQSPYFAVTRANGIALTVSTPVGGLVSGQAALLRMDGWNWQDMTKKAPVALIVDWPSMYAPETGDAQKDKKRKENIKKELEKIDTLFKQAAEYKTARGNGKSRQRFFKHDARLQALIPILQQKVPVWIRAHSLLQIETAVAWAARHHLSVVIVGGRQADLAAELLKDRNIPVIVTTVLGMPSRRDGDFDEQFGLPGRLHRAGVRFCISGGSTSNARNLPYVAAKAAAMGLPADAALKAVTLYPAQILGIQDQVGTLEPGKDATFMITDGDPLEITTQVTGLYIEGRRIDLDNKHKQLYRKYQQRYRQMGE